MPLFSLLFGIFIVHEARVLVQRFYHFGISTPTRDGGKRRRLFPLNEFLQPVDNVLVSARFIVQKIALKIGINQQCKHCDHNR